MSFSSGTNASGGTRVRSRSRDDVLDEIEPISEEYLRTARSRSPGHVNIENNVEVPDVSAEMSGPLKMTSKRSVTLRDGNLLLKEIIDIYGSGDRQRVGAAVPLRMHSIEGDNVGSTKVNVQANKNLIRIVVESTLPIQNDDKIHMDQHNQFSTLPNSAPLYLQFEKTIEKSEVPEFDPTLFGLYGSITLAIHLQYNNRESCARIREAIGLYANGSTANPTHEFKSINNSNKRMEGAAEFRERMFAGTEMIRIDRDVRVTTSQMMNNQTVEEHRYYCPPTYLPSPYLKTAASASGASRSVSNASVTTAVSSRSITPNTARSHSASIVPTALDHSVRTGQSRDTFTQHSMVNSIASNRSPSGSRRTASNKSALDDTSAGHSASSRHRSPSSKNLSTRTARSARSRNKKLGANSAKSPSNSSSSTRSRGKYEDLSTKGHRSLPKSRSSSSRSASAKTCLTGAFTSRAATPMSTAKSDGNRSRSVSQDSSPTAMLYTTPINTARDKSANSLPPTVSGRSGMFPNTSSRSNSQDSSPTALLYSTPTNTARDKSSRSNSRPRSVSRSTSLPRTARSVSQDSSRTALAFTTPTNTARNVTSRSNSADSTVTARLYEPEHRLSNVINAYEHAPTTPSTKTARSLNTATPVTTPRTANLKTPQTGELRSKSTPIRNPLTPTGRPNGAPLSPYLLRTATSHTPQAIKANVATPTSETTESEQSGKSAKRRRSTTIVAKVPTASLSSRTPAHSPHPQSTYLSTGRERTARIYSPYSVRTPQTQTPGQSPYSRNFSTTTARSTASPAPATSPTTRTAAPLPDTPRPTRNPFTSSTPRTDATQFSQSSPFNRSTKSSKGKSPLNSSTSRAPKTPNRGESSRKSLHNAINKAAEPKKEPSASEQWAGISDRKQKKIVPGPPVNAEKSCEVKVSMDHVANQVMLSAVSPTVSTAMSPFSPPTAPTATENKSLMGDQNRSERVVSQSTTSKTEVGIREESKERSSKASSRDDSMPPTARDASPNAVAVATNINANLNRHIRLEKKNKTESADPTDKDMVSLKSETSSLSNSRKSRRSQKSRRSSNLKKTGDLSSGASSKSRSGSGKSRGSRFSRSILDTAISSKSQKSPAPESAKSPAFEQPAISHSSPYFKNRENVQMVAMTPPETMQNYNLNPAVLTFPSPVSSGYPTARSISNESGQSNGRSSGLPTALSYRTPQNSSGHPTARSISNVSSGLPTAVGINTNRSSGYGGSTARSISADRPTSGVMTAQSISQSSITMPSALGETQSMTQPEPAVSNRNKMAIPYKSSKCKKLAGASGSESESRSQTSTDESIKITAIQPDGNVKVNLQITLSTSESLRARLGGSAGNGLKPICVIVNGNKVWAKQ